MPKVSVFAFFTAFLSLAPLAYAWPPTFGPEWTFYIHDAGEKRRPTEGSNVQKAQLKLVEKFKALCKNSDCKIEPIPGNFVQDYKITYSNGYYIVVGIDNAVVEVQAKPATTQEFAQNRDRIQKDVFDAMADLGYTPDSAVGGGHIHIGKESAFGNDALLFRNFLVDQFNHYDLLERKLGENDYWTLIRRLNQDQKAAFAEVIRDFDKGKIQGIEALAQAITERVYVAFPHYPDYPGREQAVNLLRMYQSKDPKASTTELRNIRPQKSTEEYSALCDLFDARLKYLKDLGRPLEVELKPSDTGSILDWAHYIHAGGYGPELKRLAGFEPDPYLRELCAHVLFETNDPAEVERLMKLTEQEGVEYPAEFSSKMTKALLAYLSIAPSSSWRSNEVWWALGQLRQNDALILIKEGLKSKYGDVRVLAAELLRKNKSDESLEVIRDLLRGQAFAPRSSFRDFLRPEYYGEQQKMRLSALKALKDRDSPLAQELLREALHDGNPEIREGAKAILQAKREDPAPTALTAHANKPNSGSAPCLKRTLHRLAWRLNADLVAKGLFISAMGGIAVVSMSPIVLANLRGNNPSYLKKEGEKAALEPLTSKPSLEMDIARNLSAHLLSSMPTESIRYLVHAWKQEHDLWSHGMGKMFVRKLDDAFSSEEKARSFLTGDFPWASIILGTMLEEQWKRGVGDRAAKNYGDWARSVVLDGRAQKQP